MAYIETFLESELTLEGFLTKHELSKSGHPTK